MNQSYFSELKNRRLMKIGGPEAQAFLQNIVTCNIDAIGDKCAGFGGLLSPQGKILFDFIVVRDGDKFLLDIAEEIADDLLKRLMFYRLRADVAMEICDDGVRIFAVWGGNAPDSGSAIVVADPRISELGWRIYSSKTPENIQSAAISDYHGHRIAVGVPEGGLDYFYGKAFPHEALYDQTGGVDFAKGCYVGQEVVSRMHHRATARKRVIQVIGDQKLPPPGTKITVLDKSVGELASVSGTKGLAMLRLDHVSDAIKADHPLIAENVPLKAQIQPWADISWPDV